MEIFDSPRILLLSTFTFVSAALAIRAAYLGPRQHFYLFKPLTTVLIIALAFTATPVRDIMPPPSDYKTLILIGLFFSLAGDVFLMLPSDRFIPGLISFFFAHVAYIAAFSLQTGLGYATSLTLPLLVYGVGYYAVLWPRLGALKVPVLVYTAAIVMMAWQAVGMWHVIYTSAAFAPLGALLFMVSDSCLAWNRFKRPFGSAEFFILGTYFTAQWLIALSIFK